MKKVIPALVITVCIVFSSNSFANTKPAVTESKDALATAAIEQAAETKIFKGTVEKLDTGAALLTEEAIYPLLGGNFENIIGKEVKITGKIIKEENVEKIVVAMVQLKKQ